MAAALAVAELTGNIGAQIRILSGRLRVGMVDHTSILADRAQILAGVPDVELGERTTAAVLLLGTTNRTLRVGAKGVLD